MVRVGAPPLFCIALSRPTLTRRLVPWMVAVAPLTVLLVACADAALRAIGLGPPPNMEAGLEGGPPEGGLDATVDVGLDGGPDVQGPDVQGPGLPPGNHLAVYWGQDLFGRANPDAGALWEQPLADACAGGPYDFVVLSYITDVASGSDGTPASFQQNFSNHCTAGSQLDGAPNLTECDDIAAGVSACHQAGKNVLIAVGEQDLGLQSDLDGSVGAQAAKSMWDLYLGGNAAARPFPGQNLDGVDLSFAVLPGETPGPGYLQFAIRLRELMNSSGGKYYLTASPECEFPDYSFGPGPEMGTVLGTIPGAFDAILVQFYYNPPCAYSPTNANGFLASFQSWAMLFRGGKPKILVGLSLDHTQVGFVDRASLPMLVSTVKSNPAFGGIALRDESFDQNSADDSGVTYGDLAASLLR
jgi:chitinase